MRDVRLTPPAVRDLELIAEYTIERHGVEQAIAYREGLLNALDLIAGNPAIGLDQSRILPNLRRLVHESHRIYYRTTDSAILILRFLGPGQDPLRHLL